MYSNLTQVLCTVILASFTMLCFGQQKNNLQRSSENAEDSEQSYVIYHFPPPFDSPDFPFSIVTIDQSTPHWAVLMYKSDPNMKEIERLYKEWRTTHPSVKDDHTRNYRKLSGYLREENGLGEEGAISLPSEESLKQKKVRKQALIEQARKDKQNYYKSSSNNTTWQSMGPWNMRRSGDWDNTHINIYAITQCLSQPNILYCTSETGGTVFKTVDKGDNWYSVSDSLITNMGPRELEVAPSDPDIVYLGTKNNIYKTTTGGHTWTSIYYKSSADIRTLLVHPSQPDKVWAGGDHGILKSSDGGANWTTVLKDTIIYDLRFKPGDPMTLYALADNNITKQTDFYKSNDGGTTWVRKTNGWPSEISASNRGGRMTTSDGHPHIIFAFIGAQWEGTKDKEGIKIMKSSDSGETWQTKVNYDNRGGINSGQGYYDWDIEMSDVDSNVVFLGTQSKWVTTTGFDSLTFNVGLNDLGHADLQEALFNGADLFVANDGGIIKFDDISFQNYEVKSNGINAMSFWSFDQGWNRDVQIGTHYHNGTSGRTDTHPDGSFLNFGGAEPNFSAVSAPRADRIWSKGYGSVNGKTMPDDIDGAISSFEYNIIPNSDGYDGSSMTTHPGYINTHFVGLDDSLMRSDDFGVTWRALSGFTFTDEVVRIIEIPRSNTDMIFVATWHDVGGKLYKSADEGSNFSEIILPVQMSVRELQLSISHADTNEFYIAGDSRIGTQDIFIYKTLDGGATWTNLWTNTLDNYSVRKLMHIDGTDGGVYLVTTEAVFYRNNSMADWLPLTDGLPMNAKIDYVKPFYKESKLRIATSRGVYGADLYDTPQLSSELLQPAMDRSEYPCGRDTIYLEDYSIVDHNGAVWSWDFPGAQAVLDTNTRRPKAVYGQGGQYNVTIKISKGGQTYQRIIEDMIKVDTACDQLDTIPGSALSLSAANEEKISFGPLNVTTNTFSFTAWVKPVGPQTAFAGIFSNGVWCAHCNDETLGLEYNYYGGNLWYRWPGSTSGWANKTSLSLPEDQWSFVAMVMTPDSVMVYQNDNRWVSYIEHEPALISSLYLGKGFYSKYFNGLIDEVTIWNKSLNRDEVRELMHLTKNPKDHPDLMVYYQFNEVDNRVINKSGNFHSALEGVSSRLPSTAPVGGGRSQTKNVTSGQANYDVADLTIDFGGASNGQVVVSKINQAPNIVPANQARIFDKQYWVIHGYNDTDAGQMDLKFSVAENLTDIDANEPQKIWLFGRNQYSDEQWTFVDSSMVVDDDLDRVTFENVSVFSQFLIASVSVGHVNCINNVIYQSQDYIADLTGSSDFIEVGDDDPINEVLIHNEDNKILKAKDYVLFKPGFSVKSPAQMTVLMEDCQLQKRK